MTLNDLSSRLARETGLNAQDPNQLETLDQLINDAAQQIWEQTDLPRALQEEIFTVDAVDPLPRVTLPARVGEIRAIRDWRDAIKIHDIRPRYNTLPWPKGDGYVFRVLDEPPICRSIDNVVGLYMEPQDGPDDLEVTIVGKTVDADQVIATFDKDGNGTAVGVLWEDVRSITKSHVTTTDVILRSGTADGAEMARIPNWASASKYIKIQLFEWILNGCAFPIASFSVGRCMEFLYKPPFRPLTEADSSFQLTGYDFPILYKAVELYRLRGLNTNATQETIAAAKIATVRSDETLNNKIQDKIQGQDLIIQFGKGRADVMNLRGLRRRRYGSTTWSGRYY